MKIAITGHTAGIGKAIADVFSSTDEIIGMSRTNGYNISDTDAIIHIAKDCDVFINNAYLGPNQTILFAAMLAEWFDDNNKTIVNINSRARYINNPRFDYDTQKKNLYSAAVLAATNFRRKCRVINLSPGYISTDSILSLYPNMSKDKMLTPVQFAEMVKWTINQPQNVEIAELSVWINMAFDTPTNP